MAALCEKVLTTVRRHGMFDHVRAAVLGVSGGSDSLALLHVMAELQTQHFPQLALHVGHLHHGIRGAEADADAKFVHCEARRHGLNCTVKQVDIPRAAREGRINEEAAGREARYAFLLGLAQTLGATRIVTGHHADDQAETVLMRIMRGAGPRGLGAIHYSRPIEAARGVCVVRPLLDCTRKEIEAFLGMRGLTPRVDRTNLSMKYLRNRVRHTLMPALENAWGDGLKNDLLSLGCAAQGLHAAGQELSRILADRHEITMQPRYVETPVEWLRRVPPALLPELIRNWMEASGLWRKTPARMHYERICALLQGQSGAVSLPGEALACVSGGAFILCDSSTQIEERFRATLRVPGATAVPPLAMRVEAEVIEGDSETLADRIAGKNPLEEFLDLDALKHPLVLRFPQPGDRMRPLGAPGTRKLHDILTDLRVPSPRRRRVLLLTMGNEPIWLAGCRIAEVVKLRPDTQKVLRLRLVTSACVVS